MSVQHLVLALAVVLSTGCAQLQIPGTPFDHPSSNFGDYRGLEGVPALPESEAELVYQGVRQARAQGGVVLHVPGDEPPVRVMPLPTDGRSVYVSNLLKDTGVKKKLGTVDATLFRHSVASIAGIPLEVRMSKDGESVKPECDYALQPGDRLRVEKASSMALTGLADLVLGR